MIALHNHGSVFMSAERVPPNACKVDTSTGSTKASGGSASSEIFSERDAEYWEQQRRYLAAAGRELQPFRVWLGAVRALMISLGSPVDQLRLLKERWRYRGRP